MAEEITKYTVSVNFDAALKKLNTFEKKMNKLSSKQESSLKSQIALQTRLNALRGKGNALSLKAPITPARGSPVTQKSGTPQLTPVAAAIRQQVSPKTVTGSDPMTEHLKAREKHLAKIQARESAPDKMTAHLKAREKHLLKNSAIESKGLASLERAKKSYQRSALFRDKARNSAEGELRAQMKIRLQAAKTADKVKQIVSDHRTSLGVLRKQGTALKKNSFLMKRMQNSSQQFAGNMIGAFAIAAAGRSIVKTGQDIESVNNTMLAVSDNAAMAGDNFQFVRKEAFRLGLGLAESGKNFAKMLSAKGNMSLDDTKSAFSGVAEMSTLLGLSAEQSNRAINALQQINYCLAS